MGRTAEITLATTTMPFSTERRDRSKRGTRAVLSSQQLIARLLRREWLPVRSVNQVGCHVSLHTSAIIWRRAKVVKCSWQATALNRPARRMLVIRPEDTSVPAAILNERERIPGQQPLTRHSDSPRDVIPIRRTPRLSRCQTRERNGPWRQSAPGRCSARVLAQPIAHAGHAVFHVPSGSYGSWHAHACPTDHAALGPALASLPSLASLGGLSGQADRPETTPPGQS